MTNKSLQADFWFPKDMGLKPTPQSLRSGHSAHTDLSESEIKTISNPGFNPTDFLLPGWPGGCLSSKASVGLGKILSRLQKDVLEQFNSTGHFNKTLQSNIYFEFLSFLNSIAQSCDGLDDYPIFWKHLHFPRSPFRNLLDDFKQLYCQRVAVIYFFKIRFLHRISRDNFLSFTHKHLINPNSFITQIFQNGTTTELHSEALRSNQYTWYRPTGVCVQELNRSLDLFDLVSFTEVHNLVADSTQRIEQDCASLNEAQGGSQGHKFSHSLSHHSFGKFLRNLLLDFPQWFSPKNAVQEGGLKVLTCKVSGNFLSSLPEAFWPHASQTHTSGNALDSYVIYPEFVGSDFDTGAYLRICTELQFLTWSLTKGKGNSTVSVQELCTLMKRIKNKFKENTETGQISLFPDSDVLNGPKYDRVILNLSEFPKNNPHFFLISQINQQLSCLHPQGLLYVFTTKKLFVPSQSDKVEQLLKKLKLESSFTLENLRGRGEVSPYLYIFRKRDAMAQGSDSRISEFTLPAGLSASEGIRERGKDDCMSFRFTGELQCFQKFSMIVDELQVLIKTRRPDSTPLYQKDLKEGLIFEFFKDAIVDGRLINSTSKDQSKITHPSFFKNMMKSCLPFGHFFAIESISGPQESRKTEFSLFPGMLPGHNQNHYESFSAVIIVDLRNSKKMRLELINVEALQAKIQEYGQALCSYFGMIPKQKDMNINLFREYFNSEIGSQIIQICLAGSSSKLKSQLQSLLIPRFFGEFARVPDHIGKGLSLLHMPREELLKKDSRMISEEFNKVRPLLLMLAPKYPWAVLSYLSYFKSNVNFFVNYLGQDNPKMSSLNFYNPQFQGLLMKAKLTPLFPNNNDLYIDFTNKYQESLKRPLTDIRLSEEPKAEIINNAVELYSKESSICKIYSEGPIVHFIGFLLKGAMNMPISHIIQNLKIPAPKDFNRIVNFCSQFLDTVVSIEQDCMKMIAEIIKNEITCSKNNGQH